MSKKRHIEPLLWSLFGAGGTTIAFFFPVIILIVGLCVPVGIIPAEALAYDRMHGFFLESWLGRLSLVVVLVPSFWACIHRIYHGMHDLGIKAGKGLKFACYSLACIVSLKTIFVML